jgi:hypothetical protein
MRQLKGCYLHLQSVQQRIAGLEKQRDPYIALSRAICGMARLSCSHWVSVDPTYIFHGEVFQALKTAVDDAVVKAAPPKKDTPSKNQSTVMWGRSAVNQRTLGGFTSLVQASTQPPRNQELKPAVDGGRHCQGIQANFMSKFHQVSILL